MVTHQPQPECRETTRSLLSTSAMAPEARRLADKAMSISRHPAQLLRHLPLRIQQLHSRQRLQQRPQQLPRLQQPRLLPRRQRPRQLPRLQRRPRLRLLRRLLEVPHLLQPQRLLRQLLLLRPQQLHRGLLPHQEVVRNQGLGRLPRHAEKLKRLTQVKSDGELRTRSESNLCEVRADHGHTLPRKALGGVSLALDSTHYKL